MDLVGVTRHWNECGCRSAREGWFLRLKDPDEVGEAPQLLLAVDPIQRVGGPG